MSNSIYRITNKVNGKFYIGKTTKSIAVRLKEHKYRSKTGNTYLHKAIRKYGEDQFSIELLESVQTNDDLNHREIYWIATLSPQYNMTKGGDGGDTSNSPNYKSAIKKAHQNRPRHKYATFGMKGKRQSSKFFESIKQSNCCQVSCEGVIFDSVGAAQKAYPGCNIRKRLDNPRYPDFIRLRERTRRK